MQVNQGLSSMQVEQTLGAETVAFSMEWLC